MTEVLESVLLLVGSLFMLLAAVGIVRMPDLFTRMQTATKASTLGAGCMLLAVAVHFNDLAVTSRAVAAIVFVILTSPVAAHMIGRAAYFSLTPLWEGTVLDELRGRYNLLTHQLDSDDNPFNNSPLPTGFRPPGYRPDPYEKMENKAAETVDEDAVEIAVEAESK